MCDVSNFVELTIEFAQRNFNGSEPTDDSFGLIPVMLLLKGGTSVSDISVNVIPSDQSPLSAEGKRCVSYTD